VTTLRGRVTRRARLWAGFRCVEPVVVLESDDWGLRRRDARDELSAWGRPSGWADERSETAEDLDRLADVLARHLDPDGRPATMTMNVIAANPDRAAIEADGFARYHDLPLDQTMAPEVRAGLRSGVDARLFSLQLHGRSHFAVDRWLADLRDDHPGARSLFAAGVDGGLSLLDGQGWRYHSELLDWSAGQARPAPELIDWLAPAMDTIERVAGVRPRSAVAAHYVLTDEAQAAWGALGIEYVQAAERRLRPDRPDGTSHLGQQGPHGLVHLTRTVRFDPRPQRVGHHGAEAGAVLRRCFDQGLPAVIDTHRINYTGPWAADAARELDDLLALADGAGARYLTTAELGDAASDGGRFRDAITGEPRRLRPVGRVPRALTRPLLGRAGT